MHSHPLLLNVSSPFSLAQFSECLSLGHLDLLHSVKALFLCQRCPDPAETQTKVAVLDYIDTKLAKSENISTLGLLSKLTWLFSHPKWSSLEWIKPKTPGSIFNVHGENWAWGRMMSARSDTVTCCVAVMLRRPLSATSTLWFCQYCQSHNTRFDQWI